MVSDAEGRGAVQLTQAKALNNATPRWSTDGQWITYDSNLCGLFQIYRVSAEGGAVRNVTNDNTGMEVLRRWKRRMALRCVTSRNAADYGNRRAEGVRKRSWSRTFIAIILCRWRRGFTT